MHDDFECGVHKGVTLTISEDRRRSGLWFQAFIEHDLTRDASGVNVFLDADALMRLCSIIGKALGG